MSNTASSPKAILMMDSRRTVSPLRHQNLTGSWSQLYKAGNLYLDLGFRFEQGQVTLMGHLVGNPQQLTTPAGRAWLYFGTHSLNAPVNATGSFRFLPPESGNYRLEVELEDQKIVVDGLNI